MSSIWRSFGWALCIMLLPALSRNAANAQESGLFSELLQTDQEAVASSVESQVQLDYEISALYNNHIEFGLSIDPNTSSLAGRENPQLKGLILQNGANLQGTIPVNERWTLQLQYRPTLEDYSGEDGSLDVFDAFTDVFTADVRFQPGNSLAPLGLSHTFSRSNRNDDTYDRTERRLRLSFGQFLEYTLALRRFDDTKTVREDFLLVGSTSQRARVQTQLGLAANLLAELEYALEYEQYSDNLNTLVLGVAGLQVGEERTDQRHFGSLRLIETIGEHWVFQGETSLLMNSSDADFYDFSSVEFALTAFYRIESERWFRLQLSHLTVGFDSRRIRGEDLIVDQDAENRQDEQWGLQLKGHWKLQNHLNLLADYQLTGNHTNETADIFEFLNYTNHVAAIRIKIHY